MIEQTAMMEQIASIPALMRKILPSVREQAEKAAACFSTVPLSRIILTGCGDSMAAAFAAKQMFLRCTGLAVQVETAIDLARHLPSAQLSDDATLVVLLSNSGNVSRIIELAKRIRQLGGQAIAVTGNADSPLYQSCAVRLKLNIPKYHRSGPGMRSYCAGLLGLFELAVSLGVARKTLPQAQAAMIAAELDRIPELLEIELPVWLTQTDRIATQLVSCGFHEFIGDGSDFGTAWFGYAKELEVAALPGCATNTEDWLHMNYFVRNVRSTALYMIMNHSAPSAGRARELLRIASEMERPVVCVTDNVAGLSLPHVALIKTPALALCEMHPLVQYLPVSLCMAHLGLLLGETDFRGTQEHWTACIGFATIGQSEEMIIT